MDDARTVFTRYYETNFWDDKSSVSGAGSNLEATEYVRKMLPRLMAGLGVQSILDIPCGDFYWFKFLQGIDWEAIRYIGADIVHALIMENREKYPNREFQTLDAIHDRLPKVDLIFCRDMLGHLPKRDVFRCLKNFRASGSRWLLTTTFPEHETLGDIRTGEWRPINLASLYGMPDAFALLNEGYTGEFADKSLGLWLLDE